MSCLAGSVAAVLAQRVCVLQRHCVGFHRGASAIEESGSRGHVVRVVAVVADLEFHNVIRKQLRDRNLPTSRLPIPCKFLRRERERERGGSGE